MAKKEIKLIKQVVPRGYMSRVIMCYAYVNKKDGTLWENQRGQQAIYSTQEDAIKDAPPIMQEEGELKPITISYPHFKK